MKNTGILYISVVMACYNADKYIEETILSVLHQTFTDFEFIIINDGSTDKSKDILERYAALDSRIILVNQSNKGLSRSLNIGLSLAKGKYIARIDADDVCLPKRFEIQYRYLEEHPTCILIGSAVNYIDEQNKYLGRSFPLMHHKQISRALESYNPIAHPTVMYRKDIILKAGGYNEMINGQFEDHFLWYGLKNYGRLKNIPVSLVNYRMLPNSLSSFQNDKAFIELRNKIIKSQQLTHDQDIKLMDVRKSIKQNETKTEKMKKLNALNFKLTNAIYQILGHIIGESVSSTIVSTLISIKLISNFK